MIAARQLTAAAGVVWLLSPLACEGLPEADTPCIRYCNAANEVAGCERYPDCEESCSELDSVYGTSCKTERNAYYTCASQTKLTCVDGHAAPVTAECGAHLNELADCDVCGRYCFSAELAGCGSSECMSSCQASREKPCRGLDDLLRCQGDGGLTCAVGGPVATWECHDAAVDAKHCRSPCLGSCLAEELSGCPQWGRDTCIAECELRLGGPCANEYLAWRECQAAFLEAGVDCNGGTAIAAGNCIDPKTACRASLPVVIRRSACSALSTRWIA
jgi:hypothetical protein